jgi:hypothetical protein
MLSIFIFPFYILGIPIIDMNLEDFDSYCQYLVTIDKDLPSIPLES